MRITQITQALFVAFAAIAQVQGGPLKNDPYLPETAGTLMAYVPAGFSNSGGRQFDRLYDAARQRDFSADTIIHAMAHIPSAQPPLPPMAKKYQRTFRILMSHSQQIDRFDPLIVKHAEANRLNPNLIKAIIAAESEFRTIAKSPAGALGLMQLMPLTAECMGVPRGQLFDPEANIRAGAAYMAYLFKTLYSRYNLKGLYSQAPEWAVRRVIAAYNGGMRFLHDRPLYNETRKYVAKVLLYKSSQVANIRRSR